MDFRSLDLNLLRIFDTLMAEGSLTRAGEVLAITQPAASHALRRLNAWFGEPLFKRSATGMTPTARAQALWPQVRTALAQLEQALAPSRFDPQQDRLQFRLAMADAAAAVIAPALVAALEAERSSIDIRLAPLATRDVHQILLDGRTDAAVGHFPDVLNLVDGGDRARLAHLPLHQSGYVCVMREGHPLAGVELTLDRYCAAHHLIVSQTGRSRSAVDEVLAAAGRTRRVVLSANQYQTAGRVLVASDLLLVMPASLLGAAGQRERLITRPPPFSLPPLAVEMVWLARREAEPAHRWLRELVQRCATF